MHYVPRGKSLSTPRITFSLIIGTAGTGKSTYMSNMIVHDESSYIVLSATHSAVDNIYNICVKTASSAGLPLPKKSRFSTLHAYFKINYKKNLVIGASTKYETIYIDEFSLLNKNTFDSCIASLYTFRSLIKIILCGDPMQLNGIYSPTEATITFADLKAYAKDYALSLDAMEHIHLNILSIPIIKKIERENILSKTKSPAIESDSTALARDSSSKLRDSVDSTALARDSSSKLRDKPKARCLSADFVDSSNVTRLTEIHRMNEHVLSILNAIYKHKDITFSYPFITLNAAVRKLVSNPNSVFLASRYDILNQIYMNFINIDSDDEALKIMNIQHEHKHVYSCTINGNLEQMKLYIGQPLIITENDESGKYYNGDECTFERYDKPTNTLYVKLGESLVGIKPTTDSYQLLNSGIPQSGIPQSELSFPIMPLQFSTIHKAQGRTIQTVIVCIDDLFDVSLLYTAITRAQSEIYFYKRSSSKPKSSSSTPPPTNAELLIFAAKVDDFNMIKDYYKL